MTPHRSRALAWVPLGVCVAMAFGCASERSASTGASAVAPSVAAPMAVVPSYIRIHQTNRVISLDIALRRFTPRRQDSPSVWLVGVTHIGDPKYYAELQSFLASQAVVLFEGVRPDSAARATATPEEAARIRRSAEDSLQGSMARSLGLAFQLSAIDYSKANFQHSDLSLAEIQALMRAHPPKADPSSKLARDASSPKQNAEFNLLLQAMDNASWLNQFLRALFGVLESSPRLQTLSKLAMIRVMGAVGDELQAAGQASQGMGQLLEVLLSARNERVLTDLKAALKPSRNSAGVAVFYGAGHMKDMASRLQSQLKYEMREERWMQAFTVDLDSAGISGFEERMIDSLVAAQIRSLGLGPSR